MNFPSCYDIIPVLLMSDGLLYDKSTTTPSMKVRLVLALWCENVQIPRLYADSLKNLTCEYRQPHGEDRQA